MVVVVVLAVVVQSSRDENIECLSWVLDAMMIVRALGNVHSRIVWRCEAVGVNAEICRLLQGYAGL